VRKDDKDKISENELLPDESAAPSATTTPVVAELLRAAADHKLTEDLALALLKRADLPAEVLEQLAKNSVALKSRKVKIAVAGHAHTPRHVSVPLARQFYTFDLVKVALSPNVSADVRVAVDNVLISRVKTVTIGERLALARRASGRVAVALLLDTGRNTDTADDGGESVEGNPSTIKTAKTIPPGLRVVRLALDNPRLTEVLLTNCVLRPDASAALVHAVAEHPKWSRRKEIRAALLRTEHLSLANALEFSQEIPPPLIGELLANSRLPPKIKNRLLSEKLPPNSRKRGPVK
jgi:hypothetical protein